MIITAKLINATRMELSNEAIALLHPTVISLANWAEASCVLTDCLPLMVIFTSLPWVAFRVLKIGKRLNHIKKLTKRTAKPKKG
jgi:hypothetical protein